MELDFQFATSSRIIFGNNTSRNIPDLIKGKGNRILMVVGKSTYRAESIIESLTSKSEIYKFQVFAEPSIDDINKGVEIARQNKCNLVLGFGGGSVIDSAKAIAALVPNKGHIMDYLEVIGAGNLLTEKPLYCIAVPTTAGTGAEVTKNAVIKSEEHNVKVSLRNDLMYPDIALVDPVLTYSLPPNLSAITGMDAFTHLLETFVSNQSNAFIDMFCREGMARIASSLKKVFLDGNDSKAREDMALASMLGGIALANVKLGAVHGFAGPLGGMSKIPHGVVCASLVAATMEININELYEKGKDLSKYEEVARILTGNNNASPVDSIVWINQLVKDLEIPSLSETGINPDIFPELVQKAKKSSSMKGNPILLNDDKLFQILDKSLS